MEFENCYFCTPQKVAPKPSQALIQKSTTTAAIKYCNSNSLELCTIQKINNQVMLLLLFDSTPLQRISVHVHRLRFSITEQASASYYTKGFTSWEFFFWNESPSLLTPSLSFVAIAHVVCNSRLRVLVSFWIWQMEPWSRPCLNTTCLLLILLSLDA